MTSHLTLSIQTHKVYSSEISIIDSLLGLQPQQRVGRTAYLSNKLAFHALKTRWIWSDPEAKPRALPKVMYLKSVNLAIDFTECYKPAEHFLTCLTVLLVSHSGYLVIESASHLTQCQGNDSFPV